MRWVICGNAVRAKVSVPDVDQIHTTVTKQGDIMIEHDQNAELRLVHELYSTMQLIQQLCILQPECRPSNFVPVAVTLCQQQTSLQCNHACTCVGQVLSHVLTASWSQCDCVSVDSVSAPGNKP